MNKTNFIGGKLKLKNQKDDKTVQQIKKVLTKDVAKVKSRIYEKEEIAIEKKVDLDKELDLENEEIIGHMNKNEEKYLKELESQINSSNNNANDEEFVDHRTQAEKLFDERWMKKLPDKIKKKIVSTSYKQRAENFNKLLSKLPEHYDIPKVGPG
jgi:hypothetical protein